MVGSLLTIATLASCNHGHHNAEEKTHSASYFNKKVECQKQEERLKKDLVVSADALQSLEEVFYSPSLDTCVAVFYSVFPGLNKLTGEIRDALSGKQLWYVERPAKGTSWEDMVAILDKHIREMGLRDER